LTKSDGEAPTCVDQSPLLILSRMSRSRVAASGTRSSASARHISATPSRLSSENSSINASTPPAFVRSARTAFGEARGEGLRGRELRGAEARFVDPRANDLLFVGAIRRPRCAHEAASAHRRPGSAGQNRKRRT
jgi:hypothetical protein